jgi:hypothetical protein
MTLNRDIKIAAITVVFTVLLIWLLSQIGCGGKHGSNSPVIAKTDTITHYITRTDTALKLVYLDRSVPVKVIRYKTDSFSYPVMLESIAQTCLDTVLYSDSIRQAGKFKAVINDTITNNGIIGRSVYFADLTPIESKTVTNTVVKKPPLVKVYLGVQGSVPVNDVRLNRFDVAPSASLIINDRYMLGIGYELFSQRAQLGLQYKISLKK